MTMKQDNSKPMECSKSSSMREVYSNTTLPQETRKTLNRQNFTHKTTGKRRRKNQYKEGNHKHQSRNKLKRNEKKQRLIKLKSEEIKLTNQLVRLIKGEKKGLQINEIRN